MKNVKEILDSLASPTPSKWREKAEWRKANRHWLRKSQQIATTILDVLSLKTLSQKDLSEKLEVSPQYINRILKGSENLSLETISKIEKALDIEIISINDISYNQVINNDWMKIVTPIFNNFVKNDNQSTFQKVEVNFSKSDTIFNTAA